MKKLFYIFLSVLFVFSSLASTGCEKKGPAEFDFTVPQFIERFNYSCGQMAPIGDMYSLPVDSGIVSAYSFDKNDLLSIWVYSTDKDKVQRMDMILSTEGLPDRNLSYRFGAYNVILLSTMLSNQEELESFIKELHLDETLPFGSGYAYANDYFEAYYLHDKEGCRLMIKHPYITGTAD